MFCKKLSRPLILSAEHAYENLDPHIEHVLLMRVCEESHAHVCACAGCLSFSFVVGMSKPEGLACVMFHSHL
jgi:hypothetical protein